MILTVTQTRAGGLPQTSQKHAITNKRAHTLVERDPFRDAYIPEGKISPYESEAIYDPHHTLDEPFAWPVCTLYSFVL